jgi:predicted GNAT family acetyltransferase
MSPHPLDNPIWSALTTQHAGLAQGDGQGNERVLRYPIELAVFVAMATPDPRSFDALARILPKDQEVAMFSRDPLSPTPEFEVTLRRDMLQMIWPAAGSAPAATDLAVLGQDDVADMRALVEKTKPGPFNSRTHELGRFLGMRIDGRLAAMVGERLHLDGFAEISAVCSDPDFRGRGLVRVLMEAVAKNIVERGEVPFLHVLADNVPAVSLYQKIGFEVRAPMCLTLLRLAT